MKEVLNRLINNQTLDREEAKRVLRGLGVINGFMCPSGSLFLVHAETQRPQVLHRRGR